MEGGCFCGFIRYQADGPGFNETSCHCTTCRRTSGAPFVAWVSVATASFRLVAGEPATFRSSDHATRGFCPRCGTALTFLDDGTPHELDLTIASLDEPARVVPKDHTWVRSQLPWVHLSDGLPRFSTSRSAS
jgi:hypothetical protein